MLNSTSQQRKANSDHYIRSTIANIEKLALSNFGENVKKVELLVEILQQFLKRLSRWL